MHAKSGQEERPAGAYGHESLYVDVNYVQACSFIMASSRSCSDGKQTLILSCKHFAHSFRGLPGDRFTLLVAGRALLGIKVSCLSASSSLLRHTFPNHANWFLNDWEVYGVWQDLSNMVLSETLEIYRCLMPKNQTQTPGLESVKPASVSFVQPGTAQRVHYFTCDESSKHFQFTLQTD